MSALHNKKYFEKHVEAAVVKFDSTLCYGRQGA
jgi:hypothetical protein